MMHCFYFLILLFICTALSTVQKKPHSSKLALQRRNTSVSAVQSSVFQWDTTVTIGGQNVILEIDTGSSFL